MKKPFLRVSDHALLRHFERVEGIDIEGMREALERRLDAKVPEQMQEGLSGIVDDVWCYRMQGKTITTVVPRNNPPLGQQGSRGSEKRDG